MNAGYQSEDLYFACDCKHPDHILHVSYISDEDYAFLSLEILLNPMPWYKRIPVAIRYLLGKRASYSTWDETLLAPDDSRKLTAVIYRFLEHSAITLKE